MDQTSKNTLEERLNKDEMKVILYIYIGQHVREHGILKKDSYLEKMGSVVQSLIDQGIVEERRWYKFDVLGISYRYMTSLREICDKKLQSIRQTLKSDFQSIPEVLYSFFVFEFLTEDISFSVRKPEWLFDWRYILLDNDTIDKYKRDFFKILIDHGACVKTHSYVSTRGGELRDKEYVITAEIRRFLSKITPRLQFPNSLNDLAIVYWLIQSQMEYQTGRTVEISIRDDELMESVNDLDTTKIEFDALLTRLNAANVLHDVNRVPGFGWEFRANRNALLTFIRMDVQDQIVKPLLSEKAKRSKERIKEERDFLKLVRTLIDRKFSIYKIAAQFAGKEIFKSLPYIERCVIDLTTPLPAKEGLHKFVGDLHQIIEESSAREVLKFREGDYVSLEDWLEIEIPAKASSLYEDAKSFFRDLNRLRNFYSHSVDAKGIFETGLIFSRLIGKYSPGKDDITATQVILLERTIRALESLHGVLELAWHKKMGVQ